MKRLMLLLSVLTVAAWAQTPVALPAGTALTVKLETTLTSSSKAGDPFSGRVVHDVQLNGKTVIPVGTTVQGRVLKATDPRRIAGKPTIAILPEAVILPNGERYVLNATLVDTSVHGRTDVNQEGQFKGAGYSNTDLIEIGAGTGAGMLIGGLAGGGEGVLIGAAVGGGATTIHWLSKHRSTTLPSGTELVMELSRDMTMASGNSGE
jgi:hypothetical protein